MSVVVVGSFVQDLSFSTECFPSLGETRIGEFTPGPGGKGFNQAVACGRQGVESLFIGALGDDLFGASLKAFVEAEATLNTHLQVIKGAQTGAASIVVNAQGQNMIIVALGANGELSSKFISQCESEIQKSSLLVCQLESNTEASCEAMKIAKANGVKTVFNPAPINSDLTKEMLSLVDILIPNETEFAFLLQHIAGIAFDDEPWRMPAEQLQELCLKLDVATVVVTLGEYGAFVSEPNEPGYFVAPHEVESLDTTGAGDAFVGGLSAAMTLFPEDFKKAVSYANVVAALSVTKKGTAPSMPSLEQVQAAIRS